MKIMWRDDNGLTKIQGDIVKELVKGFMRKEIAFNLNILINTIDDNFKSIYIITKTNGKVQLAIWGKAHGY